MIPNIVNTQVFLAEVPFPNRLKFSAISIAPATGPPIKVAINIPFSILILYSGGTGRISFSVSSDEVVTCSKINEVFVYTLS